MGIPMGDTPALPTLTARDLMGFIPLSEAARLRTQDEKTTEEQLRGDIVYVSPRRRCVRLYVALGLAPPVLPPLDHSRAPKPIEPEGKLRGVAKERIGRPRAVQAESESVR
jgi:hypothetical protein